LRKKKAPLHKNYFQIDSDALNSLTAQSPRVLFQKADYHLYQVPLKSKGFLRWFGNWYLDRSCAQAVDHAVERKFELMAVQIHRKIYHLFAGKQAWWMLAEQLQLK